MRLRWLATRPRHEATSAWVEVPLRAPRSSGATGMGAETRPGPGSFTGSVAPHRMAASTTCPGRRPEYKRSRAIFMGTGVASRHEARFRLRATERAFSVKDSARGAYHRVEGSLPGRGGISTRPVPPRAAGVPPSSDRRPDSAFPWGRRRDPCKLGTRSPRRHRSHLHRSRFHGLPSHEHGHSLPVRDTAFAPGAGARRRRRPHRTPPGTGGIETRLTSTVPHPVGAPS
jgi:hypothetical protein